MVNYKQAERISGQIRKIKVRHIAKMMNSVSAAPLHDDIFLELESIIPYGDLESKMKCDQIKTRTLSSMVFLMRTTHV